ncbi:glycoside hydrolase family 43 [Lecanosticta acicola]|uniref:Arabinan endo-1,5-alpha-L-arabinosidase n=1 Tax=Lecanosticta acicola TaxID=111012 RepID=A0AAI8Z0L0_9PEZI|nr:glycoside hydrolase family 43 [Lecanosticta acicola]
MFARLMLLACSGFSAALAYSDPGACSGVCGNTHDPSIIQRSDGRYFRFSTGGLIQIHTAPSISGPWTFACEMLSKAARLQVENNKGTDLWAPDVSLVGDVYYVYYSVSYFASQNSGIGLATSDTLECGSFTDLGPTGVASCNGSVYNAIDPNLVPTDDGYQLLFGGFWQDLYTVAFSEPPARAAGTSVQVAYDPSDKHAVEGGAMINTNGYWYLFFSAGQCCGYSRSMPAAGGEYKIKVCRSTSPTEGFVDASGTDCLQAGGTIVLESHDNVYGPGGQSVYHDSENGWIVVYHYVDTNIGYADGDKVFGWNMLDFSSGWPVIQ